MEKEKLSRRIDEKTGKLIIEGRAYQEVDMAQVIAGTESYKSQLRELEEKLAGQKRAFEQFKNVEETEELIAFREMQKLSNQFAQKVNAKAQVEYLEPQVEALKKELVERERLEKQYLVWKEKQPKSEQTTAPLSGVS